MDQLHNNMDKNPNPFCIFVSVDTGTEHLHIIEAISLMIPGQWQDRGIVHLTSTVLIAPKGAGAQSIQNKHYRFNYNQNIITAIASFLITRETP